MRLPFAALLAVVVPLAAFAQEQPAVVPEEPAQQPAEVVAPEQQPVATPAEEAAAPAVEEKKEGDHGKRGCEHHGKGDGKSCGKGCGGGDHHGGYGGGHHGVGGRWGGGRWSEARPWRVALEAGGTYGLGLNAQLTYRPRPGFAVGVGAIGFGGNALENRFGRDDDRGPSLDADVRQGYYLSLARYRGQGRGGFFAGAKLGAAETVLTAQDGTVDSLWAGFITPELGYQWFPFQRALFLRPAVGATVVVARWGGTANAPIPPFIVPTATLTLGFAL